MDNGGTNTDTEIGRSTHCGLVNTMEYNKVRVHGCILSCVTDGCNQGVREGPPSTTVLFVAAMLLALVNS